jgi:hypothetical protein
MAAMGARIAARKPLVNGHNRRCSNAGLRPAFDHIRLRIEAKTIS